MGDEKSASSIVMASRDREPRDRELLIPVADLRRRTSAAKIHRPNPPRLPPSPTTLAAFCFKFHCFVCCVWLLVKWRIRGKRRRWHPIAAMTSNRLELDALPIQIP
ncbi:hypothetical protein C1H46_003814 [Malus baccata]|uniref:Uncharacterized protein n=1 Tax=Malus baccata TaxID=106549 RepID=A0A540NHS3_MALBA|nr:hypothetical protein C1H46_003814 [Malus baccata]